MVVLENGRRELLVRRLTPELASHPNRKSGRYGRLLGDQQVRVYVPSML